MILPPAPSVLLVLLAAPTGPADIAKCHAVANAGGPYNVECNGNPTEVGIDGSGSGSCPGFPIYFSWTTDCPGGVFDDPASPTPQLTLAGPPPCPVACSVTLAVDDGFGGGDRERASVTVRDETPPVAVDGQQVLATLWPPNHRMVCFGSELVAGTMVDLCGGTVALRLSSCVSSEPDDGSGDGNTSGDCVVAPDGLSLCARAERSGGGSGRIYQISAEAEDGCGNGSGPQAVGRILVPHDRRR